MTCLVWQISDGNQLQLQFDYGNAAALHSLSVPAGIITITMVTVTITTTLL